MGNIPVNSWQEQRTANVVLQKSSWDCGIATVNTVLSLLNLEPISLDDPLVLEADAISFATLRELLQKRDLESSGYQISKEQLKEYFAAPPSPPLVVHTLSLSTRSEQPHFSLLLMVNEGLTYMLDPAEGMLVISFAKFATAWTGNVLHIPDITEIEDSVLPLITTARERFRFLRRISGKY